MYQGTRCFFQRLRIACRQVGPELFTVRFCSEVTVAIGFLDLCQLVNDEVNPVLESIIGSSAILQRQGR